MVLIVESLLMVEGVIDSAYITSRGGVWSVCVVVAAGLGIKGRYV